MVSPNDALDIQSKNFDCVILVHPTIQRLERAMDEVIRTKPLSLLDIGWELSGFLLGIPQSERTRAIRHWFEKQVETCQQPPLVCFHIDFLFLPILILDPLAMFRQAARRIKLVVLWPGEFTEKTLSYAVPSHKHYRTWELIDSSIAICRLDD
jgi:hypothetical protein